MGTLREGRFSPAPTPIPLQISLPVLGLVTFLHLFSISLPITSIRGTRIAHLDAQCFLSSLLPLCLPTDPPPWRKQSDHKPYVGSRHSPAYSHLNGSPISLRTNYTTLPVTPPAPHELPPTASLVSSLPASLCLTHSTPSPFPFQPFALTFPAWDVPLA